MSLYRSSRTTAFLVISRMNTEHILNAIKKVRSDTHMYYNHNDPVLIELLTEMDARNGIRLMELKEKVTQLEHRVRREGALPSPKRLFNISAAAAAAAGISVDRGLLDQLRDLALTVAHKRGIVTADTLRLAYSSSTEVLGLPTKDIGPVLPFVFRHKHFKKIGFLRSTYPANNGRFINAWGSAAAM